MLAREQGATRNGDRGVDGGTGDSGMVIDILGAF